MQKIKMISTYALVLLIVGSIDSIRNLPATALFGSSLIFFFVLATFIFLIPVALVSADLTSSHTEHGGVYFWATQAFGGKWGFIAIWLQWINTLVWYPTLLSFIAGSAAYLINPALAQSKLYLIPFILISFWSMTFINLFGLHISARFNSFCTTVGVAIPLALIIVLAICWVMQARPIQLSFTTNTIFPSFKHVDNWISLTAIMTSFLGIELSSVHIKHIDNPQKTFPTAMFIAVFLIMVTMLAGALSIALVIPNSQISLVSGVLQSFKLFLSTYHLTFLMPILTIMIILGSLGSMINWIIAPAKGLHQAGVDGFLPQWLLKVNKHHATSNILLLQAILVSFICLGFLLMPSVNGSYWLLTDMSTQLYVLMYVLLFIGAIIIKQKKLFPSEGFIIPGGKLGTFFIASLGLLGCALTLLVGFFPPTSLNVGSFWHYEIIFSCGLCLLILPAFLFWFRLRGLDNR